VKLPGVDPDPYAPEHRRRSLRGSLALLARQGERLSGNYVIVDEVRMRLRPIPTSG
jgi:hypothetical protein